VDDAQGARLRRRSSWPTTNTEDRTSALRKDSLSMSARRDRPAGLQPDGECGFDVAAVGSPDRQAIAGMDHGDEVPEGGANEFLNGGDVDDRRAVGTHEPGG